MKKEPIFEDTFLEAQLGSFSLSKIDGLDLKKEILNDWLQRYKSGKLNNQNETSIGADFLNDIFGDVLGFNYRNPYQWNLEKELKTFIDGQKPDGAIGYFNLDENKDNVICGVIELKDASTNLDQNQKRPNDRRTPVEQAFGYASKFTDSCKWVVVSNFHEIRLYRSTDQTKYEIFQLEKLQEEVELKKFFFLLQKEHLLSKDGTSRLERLVERNNEAKFQEINDRSAHILDKIYNLIKKFEGLSYVNPNILANAKPFNNSNEYVWHYSKFSLQSAEREIHDFFKEIKVESQKITISNHLEIELLTKGIIEHKEKIEYIIRRLNDCFIFSIECYEDIEKVKIHLSKNNVFGGSIRTGLKDYAGQLRKFSIDVREHNKVCHCISCSYLRLDFDKVLKLLKSWEGKKEHNSLAAGYFHQIFGTSNFKTSYLIFQNIAKQEKGRSDFLYFLAKFNLLRLHNLLEGEYELEDKDEIMEQIKSVDLDSILYELDVVDPDKKKALVEIRDETTKAKAEKKIEEKITFLEKAKASFNRGSRGSFPNYTYQLNQSLAAFFLHYSSNYILGDAFTEYKIICKKLLKGYLISYSIHEGYYARLKQFETFHINIIIFDLFPDEVEKLFKEYKIENILLSQEAKTDLLEKTKNFLQSNHNENIWLAPHENKYLIQALSSYHFKQIFEHIFSNLFFILSQTELEELDCKKFIPTLINFLKIDETLYHARLETLSKFILKYGKFFTPVQLIELLKLTNEKQRLDNEDLVESICYAIKEFHSHFKLNDQILVHKSILKIKEQGFSFEDLVQFWLISDEPNKEILEQEFFKRLDSNFEPYFYRKLVFNEIIDIDYKE